MKLAEKTLQVAVSQLGVSEEPIGSNSGPQVTQYLNSIGLGGGYSWCMAFVYWCTKKASSELLVTNPLIRTGGVLKQYNESTKLHVDTPQPGDVFIMDFGKGNGHTGFVEKVLPGGKIQTIEGNTNDDGSREGYEVCRRVRKVAGMKGFLRF